jgi:hypothetical protein
MLIDCLRFQNSKIFNFWSHVPFRRMCLTWKPFTNARHSMDRSFVMLLFFVHFLLFVLPARAQDVNVGESRHAQFTEWMDRYGIGKYLILRSVDSVQQKISVKLVINRSSYDSARATLAQLEEAQKKTQTGLSFEELLFYKVTYYFKLNQERTSVIISDNLSLKDVPCRVITIRFRHGKVQSIESQCLSAGAQLQLSDISLVPSSENISVSSANSKAVIIQKIEDQARAYFQGKDKDVQFKLRERGNVLRFDVFNVKHEVFKADLLDWLDPYEYLSFIFSYNTDSHTLFLTVDGMLGSGIFMPVNINGYREMEPKYSSDLKLYCDTFLNDKVFNWLKH